MIIFVQFFDGFSGVLDQYIIESTEKARDQATQWLWTYNNNRPYMDVGGITPAMKLKMVAQVLRSRPVKNGEITGQC